MSAESLYNFLTAADELLLTGLLLLITIVACITVIFITVGIIGGILGWCGDKWRGV